MIWNHKEQAGTAYRLASERGARGALDGRPKAQAGPRGDALAGMAWPMVEGAGFALFYKAGQLIRNRFAHIFVSEMSFVKKPRNSVKKPKISVKKNEGSKIKLAYYFAAHADSRKSICTKAPAQGPGGQNPAGQGLGARAGWPLLAAPCPYTYHPRALTVPPLAPIHTTPCPYPYHPWSLSVQSTTMSFPEYTYFEFYPIWAPTSEMCYTFTMSTQYLWERVALHTRNPFPKNTIILCYLHKMQKTKINILLFLHFCFFCTFCKHMLYICSNIKNLQKTCALTL